MQTLPSEMIAHVAQYCHLYDIIHLTKANKFLYNTIKMQDEKIFSKFCIQQQGTTNFYQEIANQAGTNIVQWGKYLTSAQPKYIKIVTCGSRVGKTSVLNGIVKNQPMAQDQSATIGIEFVCFQMSILIFACRWTIN